MRGPNRRRRNKGSPGGRKAVPSRELGRAWLITVINPLLTGLKAEQLTLRNRRWTWHSSTGFFESVRHVVEYIDKTYEPNFDAFLDWYPAISKALRKHDATVDSLAEEFRSLFAAILNSETFRSSVRQSDRLAPQQLDVASLHRSPPE